MTVIDINTKEDRETVFVREYVLNGGNATQAAIACGLSRATAKQAGYRMKNKLGKEIEDLQREVLKGYAPKAIQQIQGLAESAESENVRLKANTDLLDRAGYKPVEQSQVATTTVDKLSDEELMTELNQLLLQDVKDGRLKDDMRKLGFDISIEPISGKVTGL